MTELDFRNDTQQRKDLHRIMQEPALLQALAIIKAEHDGVDVRDDAPEIASARRLSRRAAVEKCVADLFRMTTAAPKQPKEPAIDFGTGINADEFDDLVGPKAT